MVYKGLRPPGSLRDSEGLYHTMISLSVSARHKKGLACIRISFINRKCGTSSKVWSNTITGLLPFRQFPVIFSSSIVWALRRWKRTEGPFGVMEAQR